MLTRQLTTLINANGKLLDLSRPVIMGIVNVTPDSFFDGGVYFNAPDAVQHALALWDAGAQILDIGAYSSRPGAFEISEQEELDRLIDVISEIRKAIPEGIISVDTFRAAVAREAVACGADMVNDVSGGGLDNQMFKTVGDLKVPYILMHMRGRPDTMQTLTDYDDLLLEITVYFRNKIIALREAGVNDIILDPGFGFAKTLAQNFQLLKHLNSFTWFGLPVLGAVSRKSMIYRALKTSAEGSLNGTTVIHTLLLQQGVQLLRVHDVREAREVVKLTELYERA